jgi:hypothetical protein
MKKGTVPFLEGLIFYVDAACVDAKKGGSPPGVGESLLDPRQEFSG